MPEAEGEGLEALREVNLRLARARQNRKQAKKLKEELDEAQGEHLRVMGQLRRLTGRAKSEAEDVAELERTTLKSIVRSILGDKEERLAEEIEEFERADERAAECKKVGAALELRVARLRGRYEELGDTRESFREVFKEKEALLLDMGGEATKRLNELTEARRDLEASRRVLKAALIPCRLCIRASGHVRYELNRYRRIGADFSSEDRDPVTPMDNAQRQAERVSSYLRELAVALQAVPGDFESPSVESYRGVPEWLERDQTEKYVQDARDLRRRLRQVRADLELHLEKTEKDQKKLVRKRRELIWTA